MRKLFLLFLIPFAFFISACTTEDDFDLCEEYPTHIDCIDESTDDEPIDEPDESADYLDIYYLNDTHGAILPDGDSMGLAYIANLITAEKIENPENVLILSGGDMLQGSALSNYFNGLSTIEIMNTMQFDAMAVGNHEFDWGLDTLLKYRDNDQDNGESLFPFLAVNIFYKGTKDIPDGIDPYTIIQKGDLKVGIIGAIGENLEYSIASRRVEDYEFVDPVPLITDYAEYLRTEENCNLIIVISHDPGDINSALSNNSGNSKVDAIFNAHSHSTYANTYSGIPTVQSGDYGKNVGHIRFSYESDIIEAVQVENLFKYSSLAFQEPLSIVQDIIDKYLLQTKDLFNDLIITAGEDLDRYELTSWISKVMRVQTGSDIAFHNYGGTRRSINNNTEINLSVLYEVWPFDNTVKTVYLDGASIESLIADGGLSYDTSITTFEADTLYKVATNDYVFDKPYNPFLEGQNIEVTGLLLRDLAVDELTLQALIYDEFHSSNDIQNVPIQNSTNESTTTE
ncbi:MAG: 5'-nucleotidase C-terminal domain-containing protein [Candidatus Izimaplasma sp.]|nr:5'-nucleotidase C-terminal domain-containing protein [Candidatus Izimaplasma bacterium]